MERQGLSFHRYIFLISLLCFLWTVSGIAQVSTANINGTVTDPSGASIPNAKVVVVAPDTGFTRQASTGSQGVYSINSIPIGTYNLTITAKGFKAFRATGIVLTVAETRTENATLQVGAATMSVNVSATAQALKTNDAVVSTVIHPTQISNIPLNGRDWSMLETMAAGAVNLSSGGQRSMRFVGRGTDDNNYHLDGIDDTGVQEQNQKAGARLSVPVSSIAEFRVSSAAYTADQGGSAGAQVQIVTKSGTNQFHGAAYDFIRNDAFDARSPFDASIPPFRMNQFGAEVGGPIRKNRTFFYANYEAIRQVLNSTEIAFVPNATFRNQVTASSPELAPFLTAWPSGQTSVDNITDQYTWVGRHTQREDSGMLRIDHTFNERTSIMGRMIIDDANINGPEDNLGGSNNPQIRPANYTIQLTHMFSPTIINVLRGGVNRSALHHYDIGTCPLSAQNNQPGTVCPSVPPFDDPDTTNLDTEIGTTLDVYDDLTLVKGVHTIKMGIGIEAHRLNNSSAGFATGSVSYASSADFINNVVDTYDFNGQLTLGGNRRKYYMPYVMDTWKIRPNLTFNYGLRYEHYTVVTEVYGRQNVVKYSCGGFCPRGTLMYSPTYKDFAPRLGLAWSPDGAKGKTVIRAGFGMYFQPDQMDDFSDGHESTATRTSVSSVDVPGLAWPVNVSLLPAAFSSPKGWDPNRVDGYFENWDFTIERQLPGQFMGQVAYVGSEGHHLFSGRPINVINPATGTRPIPVFGQYNFKNNNGYSNFHSLQVSLERHVAKGFTWGTQYMWSKSLTSSGYGAGEYPHIQNVSCIDCDYGVTPDDVTQSFSVDGVWALPFGPGQHFLNTHGVAGKLLGGWQLSGVGTAQSGRALDVTISRSSSVMLDGNNHNQRPDLVPGVSIYPANRTINNWFNPAAFAVPAPDTWGNLGRYVARGPGFYEIDTALEKKIPINERWSVAFRAEAFNLFNHPIYGNPGTNVSSGSFGVITGQLNDGATGTGSSRRLQFMLRLNF